MSTIDDLRFDIGAALAPYVDYELFQLYPKPHRTGCSAPDPCDCARTPYLSDAAWAALAPILRRLQRGAAT